jgi:hypothetical protein
MIVVALFGCSAGFLIAAVTETVCGSGLSRVFLAMSMAALTASMLLNSWGIR